MLGKVTCEEKVIVEGGATYTGESLLLSPPHADNRPKQTLLNTDILNIFDFILIPFYEFQ